MLNNKFIKVKTLYNSDITIAVSEIKFAAPYIDEIKGCCFNLFNEKKITDLYTIDERFTSPTQIISNIDITKNSCVKSYLKLKDGTIIECVEDYNDINKKLGI